ncbi:enoyl-CoA hydratase [Saccharopolyspora terrae]|uniref:Enoyl-CoA hydratase n=1 Tax=Saccharopolyspora terrae TaxID=2530384 RepID=A0A4R4VI81_9PSEU|nr:enoyl-CoA hydratase-related protein [Saccharopolyspora terrae]TDC99509.1 enoyl-CoA hydratase [Saccharopolyspora terrae]
MKRDDAEVKLVDRVAAEGLAKELYRALATGDRTSLDRLLHPGFEGHTTEGLPLDLGGDYRGPDDMRREFWGRIAKSFIARAEPAEFGFLDDGRLLVRGRYTGTAHTSGAPLDAEFIHLLSFDDGRVRELVQLTDSGRWNEAPTPAERPLETVDFRITDGIGEIRLNRPAERNALDQAVADDLYEVALRCASDSGIRALLISGNGPAFTVGGDISVFADAGEGELPAVLRRMTTPYHEALRIFSQLEAPIVTAVHGAVAGGGLGLLYVADIAFAAEGTKFATGFTSLGLSGDGGNSWFLPRLVGPRRAAELYFEQRVLEAAEAAEWGLVSHVVTADVLEERARSAAQRLAQGPIRAYGEIRRLLRDSWSSTLSQQLVAETEAIGRAAATDDALGAMTAFLAKSTPTFKGR